jgi:hypothetical protein
MREEGGAAREFLVSEAERNCSGKKKELFLKKSVAEVQEFFVSGRWGGLVGFGAFLFVGLGSFMLLDMKIHEVAMMRSY